MYVIIPVIDVELYMCGQHGVDRMCVGAKCMAWRWVDTRRFHGFCGSAGVPIMETVYEESQPDDIFCLKFNEN